MRAAAIMLACLAAAPAWAQGPADRGAIERTIRGQMEAFGHDDAPGAFAFAAPSTQQRFGDPAVFLDIVRRTYQPVYHPRAVDFTTLGTVDGRVTQAVEVVGPDGGSYTALYTMEQEPDGAWRIVACELTPSRRVGT